MTALPDLSHFTGSETFFRHGLMRNVVFSEGVSFLAEKAGCHWLVDDIALHQIEPAIRNHSFQVWKLSVTDKSGAILTVEDGNGAVIWRREYQITDFPPPGITLWCVDGTILLPSEY